MTAVFRILVAEKERALDVITVELNRHGGDSYREVKPGSCETFILEGLQRLVIMPREREEG